MWVALWDGGAVRRYTPSGDLDRVIPLPVPRVTACAFGGPGLTDLYITTARVGLTAPHPLAGSVLVVPGAGRGWPSRRSRAERGAAGAGADAGARPPVPSHPRAVQPRSTSRSPGVSGGPVSGASGGAGQGGQDRAGGGTCGSGACACW